MSSFSPFSTRETACALWPISTAIAFFSKASRHQLGDVRVLADHDARGSISTCGDLGAQPREALGQLAADRAAAQHHQPLRQHAQAPDRVGGDVAHFVDSGIAAARTVARRRRSRWSGSVRRLPARHGSRSPRSRARRSSPRLGCIRRPGRYSARPNRAARTVPITRCTRSMTSAKSNSALCALGCRSRSRVAICGQQLGRSDQRLATARSR